MRTLARVTLAAAVAIAGFGAGRAGSTAADPMPAPIPADMHARRAAELETAMQALAETDIELRKARRLARALDCPEDAAPIGFGDYAAGYWTTYRCIPLDDIAAGWTR